MATIDSVKLPDNSTYDLTDNYSGYAKKVAGATTDDLAKLTATGDLADSGKKLSDLVLKSDVKDVLNSTSTTDPLSANQGRVLNENIEAIVDVYGAKNLFENVAISQTINGLVITINADKSITCTSNNVALSNDVDVLLGVITLPVGRYIVSNAHNSDVAIGGNNYFTYLTNVNGSASWVAVSTYDVANRILDITTETQIQFRLYGDRNEVFPATTFYPMIRDPRILDPTFAPYAKTNQQLTKDVTSIFATHLNNAGAHNRYRGKALTIDADFWSHISDGTFEDQFVGDTITLNGRTYTLAHANYWLRTGSAECTDNHWVVISPTLTSTAMNNDASTAGGYLGSGFRSGTNHDSTPNTAFADALAIIKADFGASHILSHKEYLDNAVVDGYPSSGIWTDSEAELMSQIMIFGSRAFYKLTTQNNVIPNFYSVDKTQLALYAQRPDLITTRGGYWLRDTVSNTAFVAIGSYGTSDYYNASNIDAVRLVFGIKA